MKLRVFAVMAAFVAGAATMKARMLFPQSLLASDLSQNWDKQQAQADFMSAHPSKADIVIVGDSILGMINWGEYIPGHKFADRAIGGETTARILARMDSVKSTGATVGFLLAGANDVSREIPVEQTLANMRAIQRGFPGKLYILPLLPCRDDDAHCDEERPLIAAINGELAKQPNFLPIRPEMTTADMGLGNHPNVRGLEKIARTVKLVLNRTT